MLVLAAGFCDVGLLKLWPLGRYAVLFFEISSCFVSNYKTQTSGFEKASQGDFTGKEGLLKMSSAFIPRMMCHMEYVLLICPEYFVLRTSGRPGMKFYNEHVTWIVPLFTRGKRLYTAQREANHPTSAESDVPAQESVRLLKRTTL